MESSAEVRARRDELAQRAPMRPRGVWERTHWRGVDAVLLCGTLGAEFDAWQRRLAATGAADAYLAQEIGLESVEREMDALESEARVSLAAGERLLPRRSPGYGGMPLAWSREILRRLDAPRRIGVSVTDSDLLVPAKSVTAICEVVRAECRGGRDDGVS